MAVIQNRSAQRDALLALLRSVTCHPTAGWLHDNLRKTHPKISRGTVYRNLEQLYENGLILRLQSTDKQEHYDANILPHAHFCCRLCGAVHDVDAEMPDFSVFFTDKGHIVEQSRLMFYGICKGCQGQ